ncbi:MAG: Crp/Fnr family transcriptional regulator [Elusimicrobiota bacterium]|jgi:CRP-like cAMP-binding protein
MGFSKRDAPNCELCPARKNCLYELLDRDSRKEFKDIRIANRFRSGEVIFYEGEKPSTVYVVCTGKVKIFKTSRTGQQLLLRFEQPGDLVGHVSLFAGWNYADNVEAVGEAVVSLIDEETFRKFLLRHPQAAFALLCELSKDVRRGEARARDIAFKPARARLAGTLVRQVKDLVSGRKAPVISCLKRKDIAELSGLTIETTVRLLKDFEGKGYIRRQAKDITITDLERLRSLAGQDT